MHLGLIGGIGVAATVAYYERLTAALSDASYDLTIVHADVSTLIRNNLADEREAQAAAYAPLIERLKAAGADCAAITSIGGHFCFAETVARSSLPLVSAVAPLDDYFAGRGFSKVGLLGTRIVMETRLYGQLERTEGVALDDALDEVGREYTEMARAGVCDARRRAFFLDAGRRLVEEKGADAVVLAGTDLTLAFGGEEPGYEVVDALDVHVDLLARLAQGEAALADHGVRG
ncbi:MAG: aspartate/glutamate racemase family protein [Pseudomonadota bacterium]